MPNLLLFGYLLLVYPLAIFGMSSSLWFCASLLLMAHVLVLLAYLLHDCLHNNIFASTARNENLGRLLAWLLGAVSSPYAILRDKHFRHHIERADILAVNYHQVLMDRPILARSIKWGIFLHLPAVELLLQWLDFLAPFNLPQRHHLRWRAILMLATRISFFCALYFFSPLAVAGYLASYLLFLLILGFMDAFQHGYEIHYRLLGPQQKPTHDRHYEEQNTYSNLLSTRFPQVNLLVLNFCYHNVHHQKPREPWYRLPALHRQRYPQHCGQLLPLSKQLSHFHRYRIARLHKTDSDRLTGTDGVSFLVGI